MTFSSLFTKEKRVAGLEISDSVVRIAFFSTQKNKSAHKTEPKLILIEEPIADNIIEEGVVKDKELLAKTLKQIWAKADLGTDYAVVSIPNDKIYSRIFSFPKTVSGDKLTEAMKLAVSFQLPMNIEESYLDWEPVEELAHVEKRTETLVNAIDLRNANEILLAIMPRIVAQGYVEAIEEAGIRTLTLESHLASIGRVMSQSETPVLLTKKTPDGVTVFIVKNGTLHFSRTLPARYLPGSALTAEIKKIKTSFEAVYREKITEATLDDVQVQDAFITIPELAQDKDPHRWIIALGAAIRGQIPEGKDNLISMLPVGTEEAYAYQRATTLIVFIRNLVVGTSIFFVLAFTATYFAIKLSNEAARSTQVLSTASISPELLKKEDYIKNVNGLTTATQVILSETPMWSVVLEEVVARVTPGIIISGFNAPTILEPIILTGVAHDRKSLNEFKRSLKESKLFTEVELPLTKLEQKEEIPFSVSLRIADPTAVYYK